MKNTQFDEDALGFYDTYVSIDIAYTGLDYIDILYTKNIVKTTESMIY